jgi:hypothetical protein
MFTGDCVVLLANANVDPITANTYLSASGRLNAAQRCPNAPSPAEVLAFARKIPYWVKKGIKPDQAAVGYKPKI